MTAFSNPMIAAMNTTAVIAHVEGAQKNLAAAVSKYRRRTKKEFAEIILEGRILIKTIEANVSVADQAKLLTRHQIMAATGRTSTYTPWIKMIWGKHDEEGKKVKFGGEEHVKWKPDDSFGRYFNFYEVIDRDYTGPEDELLDWVLEKGGPAAIVAAELARKRGDEAPSEETKKEMRDLYLQETPVLPVPEVPFKMPETVGEYVGAILRRAGAGFEMVGISKPDAKADFDRLAAAQFDALTKVQAERKAAEQKQADLEAAAERGRQEGAERLAAMMGLSVEQMREHLSAKVAEIKAARNSSSDDQAAG